MANPSPFEQLMLEYINRARLDPQGEFDRFIVSTDPVQAIESKITSALNYFNVDLAVYQQQLAGLSPVAPLAWNSALNNAATTHSQLMIAQDSQSHQLPGEAGLVSRITAAGYDNWNYLAENVYAYTESPAYGHAGFFIDWGNTSTGIQNPAGHRNNIMNENLTEVGIGVVADSSGSTNVGPYVVTQDFGNRSDYEAQFVGVAYNDNDADNFYSMGEGAGGINVTLIPPAGGSSATVTYGSGDYQIEAPQGVNTLTFSGGGISGSVSVDVVFGSDNVKVDLVNGTRVESSADATLGDGAVDLTMLGRFMTEGIGNDGDNIITGSPGDNLLWGMGGNDVVRGGDGRDTLRGDGGRDTLEGGSGADYIYAGNDNDRVYGQDGDDWVNGNMGDDSVYGQDGDDRVYGGKGDDVVLGNKGSDTLLGGLGNDYMRGGKANDLLDGGEGSDLIYGDKNDDVLLGVAGNDTLIGGSGQDTLNGGDGNDIFDYNEIFDSLAGAASRDVIVGGFDKPGADLGDRIDVSDIDLFVFLGANGFSADGQAQLRIVDAGSQAIVQGDADGNGFADFEIEISNTTASLFTADDFIGLI